MNKISSLVLGLTGLLLGSGLVACRREEQSRTKAAREARTPIVPIAVERRADGLTYLPGAAIPYTGEVLTPHPDTPWLVKMKEPYRDGKRDGDKVELFKNGDIKTLRRYVMGKPEYAASFHKNGQKKFELNLNAADLGEGPYSRWYENGVLESTAGLDSQERWHGEFKEWTRESVLKTHHIFSHGVLVQILFESPETLAARKEKGLELQPPTPPGSGS